MNQFDFLRFDSTATDVVEYLDDLSNRKDGHTQQAILMAKGQVQLAAAMVASINRLENDSISENDFLREWDRFSEAVV